MVNWGQILVFMSQSERQKIFRLVSSAQNSDAWVKQYMENTLMLSVT